MGNKRNTNSKDRNIWRKFMKKLITFLILMLLLLPNAYAEKQVKEKKIAINYNKEYVAKFLGETVTIHFINDNGESNRITMTVTEIKYTYELKIVNKGRKVVTFYMVGDTQNAHDFKIKIKQIRNITR